MAASTKNVGRNARISDNCVPRARVLQFVALRGLALSSFGLFLLIVCEWRTFIELTAFSCDVFSARGRLAYIKHVVPVMIFLSTQIEIDW